MEVNEVKSEQKIIMTYDHKVLNAKSQVLQRDEIYKQINNDFKN